MKKTATIAVLLAGILWGMIGIFIRILSAAGLSSLQIVFMRVFFGTVILSITALVKDRNLIKIKWKDCWCFFGTGLAGFAFFNYCYFTTIQYTSLSTAAVLLYTAPSIVIIISAILFREKITLKKISALLLAFIGCMCTTGVFSGEIVLNTRGILTGLGSGLGYALVTIFTRYALNKKYNSLTIVIYTLFMASIGTCALTDVHPVFQYAFLEPKTMMLCLMFVLISTIFPNLLYTWGLSQIENGKASIIVSIEPIAATVVGAIVYGEKLGISGCCGILLMVFSLLILNMKRNSDT